MPVTKHGLKHRTAARLGCIGLAMITALSLQACQFQPLYGSDSGSLASGSSSLATISVAEVEERSAQQVRNHLIFLMTGGANPANPSHEVRLRISQNKTVLAARVANRDSGQVGNTAGSVQLNASYEIYDTTTRQVTHRGSRVTSASYDRTSQSFASERAERDAENRAARELAEKLRLAIASDLAAG